MQDEMFGRMWIAHHHDFSGDLTRGIAAVRDALARLPAWDGTTTQLLSLIVAFAITGLSFSATA